MNNTYYVLRHGEAISNEDDIISCWPEKFHNPLTKKGKGQIEKTAKRLKDIDLIFSSDLLRAKQTADIVAKKLKLKIMIDKRLREYDFGNKNGGSLLDFYKSIEGMDRFKTRIDKGENFVDIKRRMVDFLHSIDKKYKGKTILIVSHQIPIDLLRAEVKGIKNKDFKSFRKKETINNGQTYEL